MARNWRPRRSTLHTSGRARERARHFCIENSKRADYLKALRLVLRSRARRAHRARLPLSAAELRRAEWLRGSGRSAAPSRCRLRCAGTRSSPAGRRSRGCVSERTRPPMPTLPPTGSPRASRAATNSPSETPDGRERQLARRCAQCDDRGASISEITRALKS